jgi:glycosyltransferase involved in cell wall biosynthesis
MKISHPCIVFAAPCFNVVGGIENYMANMVFSFARQGWNVHCLATNSSSDNRIILEKASNFHDISSLSLSPKKVFISADIINKISPDILLINNCPLIQYALPLLNKSIKAISVLHSDDPRFYRAAAIFRDRVFRWVAPTYGVAKEAIFWVGVENQSRVRIIPHGVDPSVYSSYQRERILSGRIAFVGYIAENKGADLLLQIMQQVTLGHPAVHLTVVGYGPLRQNLEREFQEAGLSNNISFAGTASPAEVAAILRTSDILLHPTRVEGFGLAIVEAMLCGTVPIVTCFPGITDQLIDDGRNGFLVGKDDVAGFAKAVCAVIENPERSKEMSEAAAVKGMRCFSLSRMITDYEMIFEEADTRSCFHQRTKAGWCFEVVPELLRDGTLSNLSRKVGYIFS